MPVPLSRSVCLPVPLSMSTCLSLCPSLCACPTPSLGPVSGQTEESWPETRIWEVQGVTGPQVSGARHLNTEIF